MIFRWRTFIAAALIGSYILIAKGAPPVAVAAGLAGAAFFMWRRRSRVS